MAARYSDDLRRGYVIRATSRIGKGGRPFSSWWYGPDHGFGTTFGTLDHCVRVFPSRGAAKEAIASGYSGTSRLAIDSIAEARRIRDVQRAKANA